MKTNPASYYQLLELGLGGVSFQQFVDRFKEKYNTPQTNGFVFDSEIQIDYKYEQMLAASNVATLPVYMDEASLALDKDFGTYEIGSNKIPTQKHRYPIDTRILREKMILMQRYGNAALNAGTRSALLDLQFDSLDKLLKGNHNALTHQRMRIVSTGEFVINNTNNPRGIQGLKFDFNIPGANKTVLSGDERWWTDADNHDAAHQGSASDPIKFLKNLIKKARRGGYPAGHLEMSQELFDDMLTHTKVLTSVGRSLYPAAADDAGAQAYASNLADDAIKNAIERLVGAPIMVFDTYALADKFDTATKKLTQIQVENFDKKKVSFVPDGQIGTIKSVEQLIINEDPTQKTAFFDGGRTLIRETFDNQTNSMYVESSFAMLCVPNMPQYMLINTVTA